MRNVISKVKEFATNHKAATVSVGTAALTALSTCPVLAAEGTSGYLDSTVFSGISTNILSDINTNILPNAWPIFGVVLAVGIGMRLFKKVC
jgi:hypothetical protein